MILEGTNVLVLSTQWLCGIGARVRWLGCKDWRILTCNECRYKTYSPQVKLICPSLGAWGELDLKGRV
jgi:hypothetical protein